MKALFAVIGVLTTLVIGPIWHGYALSIVWGWFVAPTFGIARLSIPAAIGLSAIVGFLAKSDTDDKPTEEQWKAAALRTFVKPAVILLFCWIVRHWM